MFVVTELIEGNQLSELLDRKRKTGGKGFGARGTNNIVGGVCAALAAAHPDLPHGAVTTSTVFVNKAGRVKVSDFAMGIGHLFAAKAKLADPAWMAPEAAKGGAPTAASDIFAVGRMIYELLVGRPLVKGGPRPSEVEEVSGDVDSLVARCCHPSPDQRPDAETLKSELAAALKKQHSARASARMAPAASSPGLQMPRPSASFGAMEPSASGSLAQSIGGAGASGSHANMAVLADTEEKWLISKGKLDYGPFSLAAIVEEIRANQIVHGHVIIDKDTGGRCAVEDHPLLSELVDQAKHRRDELRRAQAEVAHEKKETRRGATLYVFIAVGVLGLALGAYFIVSSLGDNKWRPTVALAGDAAGDGGDAEYHYGVLAFDKDGKKLRESATASTKGPKALGEKAFTRISWSKVEGAAAYEVWRTKSGGDPDTTGRIGRVDEKTLTFEDQGSAADGRTWGDSIGSLEEGKLEAKIAFKEAAKRPKHSGGRKGHKGHRGGRGGGDGDSGGPLDLAAGGGDEILDQSVINGRIQRKSGSLSRCMISNGASYADIDFSIARTGRVSRVSVTGANSGASRCIKRVMKSIRFPSFNGTFTNSRFDMSF